MRGRAQLLHGRLSASLHRTVLAGMRVGRTARAVIPTLPLKQPLLGRALFFRTCSCAKPSCRIWTVATRMAVVPMALPMALPMTFPMTFPMTQSTTNIVPKEILTYVNSSCCVYFPKHCLLNYSTFCMNWAEHSLNKHATLSTTILLSHVVGRHGALSSKARDHTYLLRSIIVP